MSFKIGWFSTGRDKEARTLLEKTCRAIEEGRLGDLRISYVFSNRERGEKEESDRFIELVERIGIPLICFSSEKFNPELRKKALKEKSSDLINHWRLLYDREIMKRIEKYPVRIAFLAGYMLILGSELCRSLPLFNLHPAAPGGPRGTWQEVIWQLIRERAGESGIMIHRVTPELDAGPAVTYCTFSLRGAGFDPLWRKMEEKLRTRKLGQIQREEGEGEPLFLAIREEQKKRELPLILATLGLFARGEINPEEIKSPLYVDLRKLK